MRRICAYMLTAVLLLSGCTQPEAPPSPLPQGTAWEDFAAGANGAHRAAFDRMDTDLTPYRREFPGELIREAGFSEEELAALAEGGRHFDPRATLTAGEALADVDILFRLFYYCFAQYEYCGGQAAFDEARRAVEADLAGERLLTAGRLEEILRARLSFLTDGHSTLNDRHFAPRQRYYGSEDVALLPDGQGGYEAVVEGERQRLLSVNGDTGLDEWLFPSISEEGELVRYPGVLAPTGGKPIEAKLRFEKSTVTLTLTEAQEQVGYDGRVPFSQQWEDIPTVSLRNFSDQSLSDPFIKTGKPLSEAPMAILDLRGHGGGGLSYGASWLHAYGCGALTPICDFDLGGSASGLLLSTKAIHYLYAYDAPRRFSYMFSSQEARDAFYETSMSNYRRQGNISTLRELPPISWVEAQGTLFVLTDAAVVSGGEHLVAALRGRANTVFVGMPTGGALQGNSGTRAVLPHSALPVTLSQGLYLYYGAEDYDESVGLLPDLYVSGDSMSRVRALIGRYVLR